MDTRQMFCQKCHKSVAISDIKYGLGPNNTPIPLCSSCRNPTPKPGFNSSILQSRTPTSTTTTSTHTFAKPQISTPKTNFGTQNTNNIPRNFIPKTASKVIEPQKQEKKLYLCSRCKYQFKFAIDSGRKLICPYCGKADELSEASSDKLLYDF